MMTTYSLLPTTPNALTICNACGFRQMLPSEEGPASRGLCQECIDEDARNLTQFEGSDARALEALRRSPLTELDLHCIGTRDLEWLRRSAMRAGCVADVAILTAELENRVTP